MLIQKTFDFDELNRINNFIFTIDKNIFLDKFELTKDLTTIITSPTNLIFDERNQFCCKNKCPNYKSRCYCPPYSLSLQNIAKNKKYVIIFAKTYDFTELNYFIKNPSNFNNEFIHKKRIFVRRWVQNDFYNKIKKIFLQWGINRNDLFIGGFSLKKCKKCYSNFIKEKLECIPMPSPEAIGIDVSKSLEQFKYYLKFGVQERLSKVAMIFTDHNYEIENFRRIDGNDKPFLFIKRKNFLEILSKLKCKFDETEFVMKNVIDIHENLKPEYSWLKLWKSAIFWKTKVLNKEKIKSKIHLEIFMEDQYYALDFLCGEIFSNDEEFDGVEFI